ncbi:MAG: hypothetical protein PUP93_26900 [Rhizonema sp. NSF051]|nr:hypothetical protein [Rhizonema sp. NSF051]
MKLAHAILGVFVGSLSFLTISQNAQASYGDWNQDRYEHTNDRYQDYDRHRHWQDDNRDYDRDRRGYDHDRNRDYDRHRGHRYEEGRNDGSVRVRW